MTINHAVYCPTLRVIRQYHRMTLTQLAKKLGKRSGALSDMELGNRGVDARLINQYAKIFGMTKDSIIWLRNRIQDIPENKLYPEPPSEHKAVDILKWYTIIRRFERDQTISEEIK